MGAQYRILCGLQTHFEVSRARVFRMGYSLLAKEEEESLVLTAVNLAQCGQKEIQWKRSGSGQDVNSSEVLCELMFS